MPENDRSLIPTSAPDEVLRPAVWSGLTVIWRSASNTPEDITMPPTGVGISLIGDQRAQWRIGRGDTQTSRLKAGSVFVFAGEDFTWAENSTPYAGVALGFDAALLRRFAERAGVDGSSVQLRPAHFHEDEQLLTITKLMGIEVQSGGIGGPLYQDALATLALVHLLRTYAGTEHIGRERPGALSPHRVRRVQEYMEAHLHERLTLAVLADLVHMSPFHFARSFKLATGVPPHRYLSGMRMDRARTLLVNSKLSIAEVARLSGFSNQSHFAEQFRRATGLSPRQFTRRL